MNKMLRERLIQVAASQDVVYYSEIAPLAGLDMSSPPDGEEIGRLLGEISEFEHDQGRPLLSAVAISHDGNRPGKGFFNLAQELGLHEGSDHEVGSPGFEPLRVRHRVPDFDGFAIVDQDLLHQSVKEVFLLGVGSIADDLLEVVTNGTVEAISGLIQSAKRKARGFRSTNYLITMIYLIAGKLDFNLPTLAAGTHTE